MLIYEPFTEEAAREFDQQQSFFDSLHYQRDDLDAACQLLQIPWEDDTTVVRPPMMLLSQVYQFWQPPTIKAMWDIYQGGLVRGCVLADGVGSGKTWEMVGFLLLVHKASHPL